MKTAETTLSKVMNILGMKKVELAEKKNEDGSVTFDSENFAVDEVVQIVTAEGEKIATPPGEYVLEDGTVITVDDKSTIVEVATKGEEETEEEIEAKKKAKMQEEQPPAATEEMNKQMPKKTIETMTKETQFSAVEEIQKQMAELSVKLAALETENAELKTRLAEEPAAHSKHNPEEKNPSQKIFKLGSKREETIEDRVMNNLFS